METIKTVLEKVRAGILSARKEEEIGSSSNKVNYKELLDNNFLVKPLREAKWDKVQKSILIVFKQLKEEGSIKHKGLYIFGGNGTGKTYILHLLAKYYLKHLNLQSYYYRYEELKNIIYKKEYIKLQNIKYSQVLMLDEFGKGTDSEFYNEKIETIIDERLNRYLPTLIASNFSIQDISERGYTAIADRLLDKSSFKIIELSGKSLRG